MRNEIRINDLCRELEVKAKTVLESLPRFGISEKKTHSSSISRELADRVRAYFRALKDAERVGRTITPSALRLPGQMESATRALILPGAEIPPSLPSTVVTRIQNLIATVVNTMASVSKGRGDVDMQMTQIDRCLFEFEELAGAVREEFAEIRKRHEILDSADHGVLPIDSVMLTNYQSKMGAILDKIEKKANKGERASSRIGRLPIPRHIRALMSLITEARNAAVHEQHICRGAEAKAVRSAWKPIYLWARSEKLLSKKSGEKGLSVANGS